LDEYAVQKWAVEQTFWIDHVLLPVDIPFYIISICDIKASFVTRYCSVIPILLSWNLPENGNILLKSVIVFEPINWTDLPQDTVQWHAFANKLMKAFITCLEQ
jgi:hypothetical protein